MTPLQLAANVDEHIATLATRLASPQGVVLTPEDHMLIVERLASAMSGIAQCLDAQAEGLDPTHSAGSGMPWTLMRLARDVRDVVYRLSHALPVRLTQTGQTAPHVRDRALIT